jgi:plasmid maintenance system antidote protein VapI
MINFTDLISQAEHDDDFWVESAKLHFVIELNRLLKERNMKFADLARSIDRSPAYVSKIMAGDTNFTIETMVKLARRLGCQLEIKLDHQQQEVDTERLSFDAFIAERSAGQIGRYCFSGSISPKPQNDNLYQDQEYQYAA